MYASKGYTQIFLQTTFKMKKKYILMVFHKLISTVFLMPEEVLNILK